MSPDTAIVLRNKKSSSTPLLPRPTVFAHGPTVLRNDRRTSNDATDTPTSTCNNSITMTPIEEALAAIESQEPGDDLVYQEYADWFGVNRVTLA
jgi:hypothetical protein